MAVTNFTPLLGLALPTTGDLSGTWGTTVNDAITTLLDSAVAGTVTLSVDTDVTLSTTNGADNQARNAIIRWTASNGATTRNITAPAQSKAYFVINDGTGSIVIRGAGPTTGVTVPAAGRALVAWNGTDFIKVLSNPITLTTDVTGTLPVANGGTGLTSPGTTGNILTSTGSAWVSSAPAPGGIEYVVKTGNYTTQNNEGVLADTSGGAFTVTLPATPAVGDQCVVADPTGDWATNNLTVGRNGSTIAGSASDLVCDIGGVSVQLVYDGSTWNVYAQVGGNGGTAVTLTGVQTLTNKTLTSPVINTPTVTNITNEGAITEEVYALGTSGSLALEPDNGTIQTCALTGNPTFTDALSSGQSIVLMLTNGASYTVTWPTITWATSTGDTAPTLTAADTLVFWKISSTLYGAYVGSYA